MQGVELHLVNPVWEVEFTLGSTVWTKFDPLGLFVKIERKPHDEKEDVTVTKIHIKADVIDRSSGVKQQDGSYRPRTEEEVMEIRNRVESGIRQQFDTKNIVNGQGKEEIDLSVDITHVMSDRDIKDHNLHVIDIVDKIPRLGATDPAGMAPIGGKKVTLENSMLDKPKHLNQFEKLVGHEFGHTMGLMHPFPPMTERQKMIAQRIGRYPNKKGYDRRNKVDIKYPDKNFMGYNSYKNIEVSQLIEMSDLSMENKLNKDE